MLALYYSHHEDEDALRAELETHLSPLHRAGLISGRGPANVRAGEDCLEQRQIHMESARVIVLLLSESYLSCPTCQQERERALERQAWQGTRVIPVLVRPIGLGAAWLARLEILPRNRIAVVDWEDRDEAWLAVARGIEERVSDMGPLAARDCSEAASPSGATGGIVITGTVSGHTVAIGHHQIVEVGSATRKMK